MRNEIGSIAGDGDRYRVYTSAGYDKRTGKRVRPSKVVRGSKNEAKKQLTVQLMRAGKLTPDKITLTEFMEDVWLPTKSAVRRTTRQGYACKIATCVAPYIGHLPLTSIDAYVVERWIGDMTNDGKSPQTIVHARAVLKNAMRAAVRWRHVDHDPTEGTPKPRSDYRPRILTSEQVNAYLDAFAGHEIEPLVVVEFATGARRSEVCALDWADIDFEAGTVTIKRGFHQHGGEVWFEEPKSDTSRRTLKLTDWALEALKTLRGVGPLVAHRGARMKPERVSRLYKAHVLDSKLPYVTIRELRNTHGTYLRSQGSAISDIADTLGHADERVTKAHYVDRDSLPVNTATVGILEGLRVRQSAPSSQSKHGQNPQETENGSPKAVGDTR